MKRKLCHECGYVLDADHCCHVEPMCPNFGTMDVWDDDADQRWLDEREEEYPERRYVTRRGKGKE